MKNTEILLSVRRSLLQSHTVGLCAECICRYFPVINKSFCGEDVLWLPACVFEVMTPSHMPCLLTHNSKQLLHFKLVCSRIPTNNISVKPVQICAPRASIYKTPKQLKCKIYFPWISLSYVSWCQARWSHSSLTHGDLTMKIPRRKMNKNSDFDLWDHRKDFQFTTVHHRRALTSQSSLWILSIYGFSSHGCRALTWRTKMSSS